MTKPQPSSAEKDATADDDAVTDEVDEPAQDTEAAAELTEGAAEDDEDVESAPQETREVERRFSWARVLACGVLPGLALALAMAAGFLKWHASLEETDMSRIESVQAARDSTVALLSYRPDTVEQDLGAARDRLTGQFKDSYTSLTRDVVIPGAKQKQISAIATVPAAASVSAGLNHAVVLVFVNQTTTVGTSVPTDTASSVRVTLDKIDGRWLISGFDPV